MPIYGYVSAGKKRSCDRKSERLYGYDPSIVLYREMEEDPFMGSAEWEELLNWVRGGDTIVVESVLEIPGSSKEKAETFIELWKSGIRIVFLNEASLNTEVYENELSGMSENERRCFCRSLRHLAYVQVFAACENRKAEKEAMNRKVRDGIETAKSEGKQVGRKAGVQITTDKERHAKKMIRKDAKYFGGTKSDAELIDILGISTSTYYTYKKELKEAEGQIPGQTRLADW